MSAFKYTINGKEYLVEIESIEDTTAHLTVNGEEYTVELEQNEKEEKPTVVLGQPTADEPQEQNTATTANINTANALKAPLPGIVIEIRVKVGDVVNAGDTLVVLEAMKMANNLDAEKSGTVTAICVKVGESVLEDAPLVVVE